jgi:OmpA-OmpF porin, OOP family
MREIFFCLFLGLKIKKMKKLVAVLIIAASFAATAQDNMNKWSAGISIGGHDGQAPTWGHTRLYQIHHYGVNGRYMFNNRFGLMLDLGYDLFDYYGSGDRNPRYWRTSIQGVVNAGDMIKLNSIHENLGLLIHGGTGLSHMWVPKDYKQEEPNDPFIKNSDDMVNWIFGATPQWKINEQVSLNADLSFIFHTRQSYDFTQTHVNKRNGIDGYFLNLSVGATFYFGGKDKKHADWTPTVYGGSSTVDMSAYEAKIAQLEAQLKDDDGDGVPNARDMEPNTPKGALVDSKGVQIADRDGDGVPDKNDLCPDEAGDFGGSGCPDSDGDGIPDHLDQCPDVYGSWKYQGCPVISKEVKEVLDKALAGVNFETGKATLLKESYKPLDAVVKVMTENPTYKLKITGHTDNVGTPESNMQLSKDRAQAVEAYLESKGLDADRFVVIGFGDTRPVSTNDTPEGRAKNRRVEFTVMF